MKKIYAFLAAALISVCAFASKDVVPGDEAIKNAAEYNDGEVCVAIFVPADMACNDIVFVGTYNNWGKGEGKVEDAKNCKKFVAIDGFDGWYAVSVADETASPEGKPVMLDVDGNFNWSYQIGEATVIRGGVTVVAGLPGEIDLKTYGKDAPNVYTVEAWKSNPCTAFKHSPVAPVTMGFQMKFQFYNFDLGMSFRANIGNYVFNNVISTRLQNVPIGSLSRNGYFSTLPVAVFDAYYVDAYNTHIFSEDGMAEVTTGDYSITDRFLENASFLRCDNITLGYSFTTPKVSGRAYCTVSNPFVITKYSGLDPICCPVRLLV